MSAAGDRTIWRLMAFFAVILVVFVAAAALALRNIGREVAGSDWVNHTHSVILETEGLRSELYIADGAAHAFVVTGDPRDRRSAVDALSEVDNHLSILGALTRTETAQGDQVSRITVIVDRRADAIRAILSARQSGDTATLHALLADDAGQPALRQIQIAVEGLKGDELGLLTERDTASFLRAQATRWTVWASVALDFLLLCGAGWLVRDDLAARRRAAAVLADANNLLEVKVAERTAELGAANRHLTSENLERRWTNQGLEHQLRYNHLIINSINDLVLVLTKAANISRANPAVARMSGRENHELMNLPLSAFARLTHAGPAPMLDPVAQAMREGHDLRDQAAVVVDKLGREIPATMALYPLRDGDKIVGAVVILHPGPPPGETAKA
jgi:CHASE3 domain sensor protein